MTEEEKNYGQAHPTSVISTKIHQELLETIHDWIFWRHGNSRSFRHRGTIHGRTIWSGGGRRSRCRRRCTWSRNIIFRRKLFPPHLVVNNSSRNSWLEDSFQKFTLIFDHSTYLLWWPIFFIWKLQFCKLTFVEVLFLLLFWICNVYVNAVLPTKI